MKSNLNVTTNFLSQILRIGHRKAFLKWICARAFSCVFCVHWLSTIEAISIKYLPNIYEWRFAFASFLYRDKMCVFCNLFYYIFSHFFFCLYLIWISKEEGEEKQDYISLWYFTFTKYLFDKIVYKILQIHLFIADRNFDCAHFLSSP